jgi:hypothetical protein
VLVFLLLRVLMLVVVMRMLMLVVVSMLMFVLLVRMRMSVFVLLVLVGTMHGAFVDGELHALDLFALLAVEVQMEIADRQLGEFPFEAGRADSKIDQCTDGHVAADAGDAVEKKDFHEKIEGWVRSPRIHSKTSANLGEIDFPVVERLADDAAVEARHLREP